MIKRKYLAACLVAALFVAGCGSNSAEKKETTETTEETKTAEATDAPDQEPASEEDAQDETAADDSGEADDSTDEDEQDLTDTEEGEDTGLEEEDLSKVVPADYLVQDADKYVTLGETKDLEAVQYTYEITDDMVQDEIDSELSEASEEISTDKPSVEGDTVYFTMTYKVEGDDSQDGEEEDSSEILGQEDYGAEFDEKLTGVSAGDKLDFSVVEAARDLGASPLHAFFTVTVPLTLPGLMAGCVLVFIPSMGLFFLNDLLGGSKSVLAGGLIQQLINSRDLPMAAALSVLLLAVTGAVIAVYRKVGGTGDMSMF